ncbi:hypothetical protein EIP91_001016 [Steccherinum ochraceum]|uniref:PH domain-containing protein n=1 Tax=Steccherinum ochraceum TaxID=92696 RepID=A0A4R0RIS5_9APHY|nr:hypothetical protein EIP91_001016 [Steccherinum ochraceum]
MSRADHHPPLTRASTAYDSEPVLTPTDITPGYQYKGGYGGGGVGIRQECSVGSSAGGSSYLHGIPQGLNAIREDGQYDAEPFGPYFSLPVNSTAAPPRLFRRTTTKELISRYESLESESGDRSSVAQSSYSPHSEHLPEAAQKRPKGRSPIRQSFRNLLSAIGKKAKGFGKDHSSNAPSRSSQSICLDSPPIPPSVSTTRPTSTYLEIPSPMAFASRSASGMPACNTPSALHTGPLLYLSKPISAGDLPVWTDCTAILHPSHILITWLTSHENPSTSMITLPQCSDVRSLALNDLDSTERNLLPMQPNTGELKVFELLFEGRGREKFAAYSVTGRASWVSAIWDAVLLCQDRKSIAASPVITDESASGASVTTSPAATGHLLLNAESMYTPNPAPSTAAPSVVSSGHVRPESSPVELPELSESRRVPDQSPVAPQSCVPTVETAASREQSACPANTAYALATALLATPTSSRSQSPSIMNLSQSSMVKQRLAEIERTNSMKSQACNTPRSSRSRQYSPLPHSPLTPTSPTKTTSALRVDTSSVVDEESIINSYALSPEGGSPLSVFAGRSDRLTSVPSRAGSVRTRLTETPSEQERTPKPGELNQPIAPDVFSPTSAYSTDFLSPLPTPGRMPFSNINEVIDSSQKTAPSRAPSQASYRSGASSNRRSRAATEERSRLSSIVEVASPAPVHPPSPKFEDLPPTEPPQPTHRLIRMSVPPAPRQKTPPPPLQYEDLPATENANGPLIFRSPRPEATPLPNYARTPTVRHTSPPPAPSRSDSEQVDQSPRREYQSPVEARQRTPVVRNEPPAEAQPKTPLLRPPSPSDHEGRHQYQFPSETRQKALPLVRNETPAEAKQKTPVFRPYSLSGHDERYQYQSPVETRQKTLAVHDGLPTEATQRASVFRNHPSNDQEDRYQDSEDRRQYQSPVDARQDADHILAGPKPRAPVFRTQPPSGHESRYLPPPSPVRQKLQSPVVLYDRRRPASPASPVYQHPMSVPRESSPQLKLQTPRQEDVPVSYCPPSPEPSSPIIPFGAQKTPLMMALESAQSYSAPPPRGPPRPTHLTKPALLSADAYESHDPTPADRAPTTVAMPTPPPSASESRAPSPIEPAPVGQTQKNLPSEPLPDPPKRRSGLFAALRRPRRRSAEPLAQQQEPEAEAVSVSAPEASLQVPSARDDFDDIVVVRNEAPPAPIVQVVKEVIVERIPAPPVIEVDEETKQIMQNVEGTMGELVEHENWNAGQLTGIRTQVDTVLQELRQLPKPTTPSLSPIRSPLQLPPSPQQSVMNLPPPMDVSEITGRLDEMGTALNTNLPELFVKVEELMKRAAALQQAKSVVVMKNVPVVPKEELASDDASEGQDVTSPMVEAMPGGIGSDTPAESSQVPAADSVAVETSEEQPTRLELFDPTQLEGKLDLLLTLCEQLRTAPQTAKNEEESGATPEQTQKPVEPFGDEAGSPADANTSPPVPSAELQEILELLKADFEHRTAQGDQNTDSVRYLHELNSWLEAFVNHGTSQIDNVLAGVQHLCNQLGPVPEVQVMQDVGPDGAPQPLQEPPNLLSDVRSLLTVSKEREGNTLALEASVNGLVAVVHEELRRNAESRNALTTESIVALIERHRQDQERLLRNVASDLSNDIRGERLRFVEAMKEATAINVQIHVEEFKKELTREVLLMTQEVGRLQKERQNLEQQIADLFSFYAKQKQPNPGQPSRPPRGTPSPSPRMQHPRPLPSMRRRPLPTPSPRPPSAMG